ALAFIMNDQDHGLGRELACVGGFDYVLLPAQIGEVGERFLALHGLAPGIGPGHGYGYRLARFNVNVNAAAPRPRVIDPALMVVRGIKPHRLGVRGKPLEDFLLAQYRYCRRTDQKQHKHTSGSHEYSPLRWCNSRPGFLPPTRPKCSGTSGSQRL